MANINQIARYTRGYISADGVQSQKRPLIAGVVGLNLQGSTDISGSCCDYSGNIYVTDAYQNIVLKITESGNISVVAGVAGVSLPGKKPPSFREGMNCLIQTHSNY